MGMGLTLTPLTFARGAAYTDTISTNTRPAFPTIFSKPWFETYPAKNKTFVFVQCWTNVEDVGPTLYKCYTNVLCLLGIQCFIGYSGGMRYRSHKNNHTPSWHARGNFVLFTNSGLTQKYYNWQHQFTKLVDFKIWYRLICFRQVKCIILESVGVTMW